MKLLLDAHTLIWSVDDPSQLSSVVVAALQDPTNALILSAGTIWEIAIKVGRKKLTLTLPYRQWMNQAAFDLQLSLLPITVEHADHQSSLPDHHRDPFDRLLAAQALVESLSIVSIDPAFDAYGVSRLW